MYVAPVVVRMDNRPRASGASPSPAEMRPIALLVFGVAFAFPEAVAQVGVSVPDTLVFERIGPPEVTVNANNVAFDADTVHVLYADVAVRRTLRGSDWTTGWSPSFVSSRNTGKGDLRFDPDGVIYQGREGFKYDRSDNRGRTWTRADYPGTVFPLRTPGGALLGTWNEVGYGVARSEDNGATWTPVPYLPGNDSGIPYVYHVLPPAAGRAAPRIVACGRLALAYSDDDGRTWTATDVSYAVLCRSMVRVEGGPHDGALLAQVDDFRGPSPRAGIWRTTDGAAWERVGQVFEDGTTVYLAAGPGGVVLGWDKTHDRVSGSDDGGATWRLLTATLSGVGAGSHLNILKDLEVGPDGHVYAATSRPFASWRGGEGLYRSVAPVVAVAEEPGAPVPSPMRVSVRPNPAGQRAEVVLTLAEARPVRVSVFDVQGREVAVVLDGVALAGEQRLPVDTSGWPAGVYVVRASAGLRVASAQLVVVR